MAVYKFSRNMVDGRPVIVYESSEPVGRDLTYISDVVNGVLGALEHSPVCCGELYNIGSGKTVNLLDIVRILEEKLNVSANLVSWIMVIERLDELILPVYGYNVGVG